MKEQNKQRTRRPNKPHPTFSLATALEVMDTIQEKNAGKPINRVLLAEFMGMGPGKTQFRERLASSSKYGLTEGSYRAATISPTRLGTEYATSSTDEGRLQATRKAFRSVPIYDQILEYYNNARLPEDGDLANALSRDPFNVDEAWTLEVATVFSKGLVGLGYLRSNGYIVLKAAAEPPAVEPQGDSDLASEGSEDENEETTGARPDRGTTKPFKLFIAHGKIHPPLNDLTELLDRMNVKYAVVKDEANAGRPISQKVADTLHECTAGIFIFTVENEVFDKNQQPLAWPNLNVVFELGAASLLYGKKIVIFKQDGVEFPSDFRDLGYITFEGDSLKSAAGNLLTELIALDAIEINAKQ